MSEIAVNPEKKFIVAKTRVEKRILCNSGIFHKNVPQASVKFREGFDLYCSWRSGDINKFEKVTYSEFFNDNFIKNEKYEGFCTLYWIARNKVPNGGLIIKVPLGCNIKNAGGFNIELKLNVINVEKLINEFSSSAWEREYVNNFVIEYLSEYFIDSNGKQRGVSIELREYLKPTFENFVATTQSREGAKNEIFRKHKQLLEDCGLEEVKC